MRAGRKQALSLLGRVETGLVFPQKVKDTVSAEPRDSTPGCLPREMDVHIHTDTCAWMPAAASFT